MEEIGGKIFFGWLANNQLRKGSKYLPDGQTGLHSLNERKKSGSTSGNHLRGTDMFFIPHERHRWGNSAERLGRDKRLQAKG